MAGLGVLLRDIEVLTADLRSPKAKSKRLATFAAEKIAEAKRINGQTTEPEIIVDGRKGAPLTSVRPDGVIVANFDLLGEVLEWISAELVRNSPVLTGKYARSHVLEVDGVEHDPAQPIPVGERYLFVNRQPYARKMEPGRKVRRHREKRGRGKTEFITEIWMGRGQSDIAPDGVYQAVAAVAANRFGNIAKIQFVWNYFDYETGVSHPAIIVKAS